jgi:hypothetical protein
MTPRSQQFLKEFQANIQNNVGNRLSPELGTFLLQRVEQFLNSWPSTAAQEMREQKEVDQAQQAAQQAQG